MYQLNPLLESDNDREPSKLKTVGAGLGAYASGIAGANTIKNSFDKITGIETRYHNTPGHVADQVLDQGILSKYATDPHNLTNTVLGKKAKDQGLDGLVYLAKKKSLADGVGRNRVLQGIELSNGRTLKIKIPYDEYLKLKKVANSELLGASNADDYLRRLTTDPSVVSKLKAGLEKLPPNQKKYFNKFLATGKFEDLHYLPKSIMKALMKQNFKAVGKGTDTIKGDIAPEFIKGSKHFRDGMLKSNFANYVRKHPGRFAQGVGTAGLGVAGIGAAGYLGKKWYDGVKLANQLNKEKKA